MTPSKLKKPLFIKAKHQMLVFKQIKIFIKIWSGFVQVIRWVRGVQCVHVCADPQGYPWQTCQLPCKKANFNEHPSPDFHCSWGRGLLRPLHLGSYLYRYLCTSWQDLRYVCAWVQMPWVRRGPFSLAHTARAESTQGEWASVWRLKIEKRVWDDCSQTNSVESLLSGMRVGVGAAFNSSHCCALSFTACEPKNNSLQCWIQIQNHVLHRLRRASPL